MAAYQTYLAQHWISDSRDCPNDNVAVVGISGGGKSLSVEYPTMLHNTDASIIANFGKSREAYRMAAFYKRQGFQVYMINLDEPSLGDVFYDPLKDIASQDDITALSHKIVYSCLQNSRDDYWALKSLPLSDCLIDAALQVYQHPNMCDVLDFFDQLTASDYGTGVSAELREIFEILKENDPESAAWRRFNAFDKLNTRSERTGACIIDTLDAAYNTVFPETVRKAIQTLPSFDFRQLGREKTALFIICSPVKSSLNHYANLIYDHGIEVLMEYAQTFEDGKLPVKVKLFFDDFGCTAPIQSFPEYMSIFRSAGLSVMLLIQSESMLQSIYGMDKATLILNNCARYVYFPGGMDRVTCKSVSERMNMPLEEVMYAPVGHVFIMQSGHQPIISPRYEIFKDPSFRLLMAKNTERSE